MAYAAFHDGLAKIVFVARRRAQGTLRFVDAGVDWNPNAAFRRLALVRVCRRGLDSRLSESEHRASRI
jgi:hypothetical protein